MKILSRNFNSVSLRTLTTRCVVATLALSLFGCGSSIDPAQPEPTPVTKKSITNDTPQTSVQQTFGAKTESKQPTREFKPVTVGLSGSNNSSSKDGSTRSAARSIQEIIDQLKPIQIMLGQWRGTTRKEYDGFKAVDNHEWVWDLQTDADKPSLVMESDNSPYIKVARLTTGEAAETFLLTITTPAGNMRTLHGKFTEPVSDVAGDDNKLHRTFRLQFEQSDDEKEQWRFTFHQQENNRYLLEVDRRRGKAAFRRYDTVSTQREGTSFALSDSDYGEKTCIISQGLGTTSISYNGKTYWVCCSGCKAAFEDDPEKWIAAAAERDKNKK
jgi:hypothetical protein